MKVRTDITKFLYIVSFMILCFFTFDVASESESESESESAIDNNDADVANVTVVDDDDEKQPVINYGGVNSYECDAQLKPLEGDDRAAKIVGTLIRVCFVPDAVAIEAGAGIEKVNNFVWRTSKKNGEELVQKVVINGTGDNILSAITCKYDGDDGDEAKSICVLETLLTSGFFFNTASVLGTGEATLTKGEGTVPVARDIFYVNFSFQFTHDGPDGAKMTDEETKEMLQKMDEHNAALESGEAIESGEDNMSMSMPVSDTKDNNEEVKEEVKDEL